MTLIVRAYDEKTKRDNEEKLALTYMNALWTAQWFSKKKPPKLEKLLNKKPKVMTDNEMLETVKRLNELFGGEIQNETPEERSVK